MRLTPLVLSLGLLHCGAHTLRPAPALAPVRPAPAVPTPSSDAGASEPAAQGEAPPHVRVVPSVGCLDEPLVENFALQPAALATLGLQAPAQPVERAEGYLRFTLPGAWGATRSAGATYSSWRVRTGDDEDVAQVLVGDQLPFALHAGDAFRVRLGPVLVRGTRWSEHGRQHLEALALLPCASPRFAQLSFHTNDAARFDTMLATLRSLRLAPESRTDGLEVALEAPRDTAAIDALTADDPAGRALLREALGAGRLRASHALPATGPLDELSLEGQLTRSIGGVEVQLWLRARVRDGRAVVPGLVRGIDGAPLAAALAEARRAGCGHARVTVASDGLAVTCAHEPEVRVVLEDPTTREPNALANTVRRWLSVRALWARWRAEGARVHPWPASLCESDRMRIAVSDDALRVTADRCALALTPEGNAIVASSFTGDCAQLPNEPWARPAREAVHLEELAGTGAAGSCRWTLGTHGAQRWMVAAGDGGSALEPLAQGRTQVPVDRRALVAALGFVRELQSALTSPGAAPPENADPAVLETLGVYRSGGAAATATLRGLYLAGALADDDTVRPGPGATAVLSVHSPDLERVEVEMLPLTVTLEHASDGRWRVTGARATRWR